MSKHSSICSLHFSGKMIILTLAVTIPKIVNLFQRQKKNYRKIGNSSGMFSFPSGLSQGRSRIVTRQPCKKSYHFTAHRWSLVQESGIVLQATIPLTLCRFNTGSWDLLDFWGQAVVLLLHSEEHQ